MGCPSWRILWTVIKALKVCTSSDKMGRTRSAAQIEVELR